MSVATIKEEFRSLANVDKIKLVQELWDEIGDPEEAFILTPEQVAELDTRYQRTLHLAAQGLRVHGRRPTTGGLGPSQSA